MKHTSHRMIRRGFTLIELSVVIIAVGMIAAFAVPRLLDSMERTKAAAAFHYLDAVRSAQEKFQIRRGVYADDVTKLELDQPAPGDFVIGKPAPADAGTLSDSWTLTLTRAGSAVGYGGYTVVYTKDGFDPKRSNVPARITPPRMN